MIPDYISPETERAARRTDYLQGKTDMELLASFDAHVARNLTPADVIPTTLKNAKNKTWTDLLGRDTTNCIVDEFYIVRCDGDARQVLWSFPNNTIAQEVFAAWVAEAQNQW